MSGIFTDERTAIEVAVADLKHAKEQTGGFECHDDTVAAPCKEALEEDLLAL